MKPVQRFAVMAVIALSSASTPSATVVAAADPNGGAIRPGPLAQAQVQAQPAGSKRTDLQRHDLSVPGREVVQVRVDFDPGYASPRHTHPGEEIIYVLEGTLEYQVEGQPTATYKAGDVLLVPAGKIHAAKNVGGVNGAELATYIVEKGKPLITLVK